MGFTDTPVTGKLVNILETDEKKLRKRLAKIETELERAHSTEFNAQVGTSAYWKKHRKIDYLAQEKFEIKQKLETLTQQNVPSENPLFAVKDGKVVGMVVNESQGWILRIGGSGGCNGHHDTREMCTQTALKYGFTFAIDIDAK